MTKAQVRFLRSGESLVDADTIRAEITRLIGAVLERLDAEGISGTYLHDEWAAIASADAEESAFCRAAAALGLNGTVFKSVEEIAKPLKVPHAQLQDVVLGPMGLDFADALVSLNRQDSPRFVVEKRHRSSRLFTFCRALFDYVSAERSLPALVVDAHTEQQRRNRAFAAEFLAPAYLIGRKIRGRRVGGEEIHDIAGEFGVSDFVVKHQIENHRLASVVGA